ncbi:MAG: HEAT repeat domain-containing protein [Candidatus Lokiarchaeota archaeon]|nr:HEAT repeat domain-containing protein [Candidatus Lokiarchaeota archaeon]
MEFRDLKENYLKETVPENKISMIKSFSSLIDKNNLNFFASQYKNESDGKVRAKIVKVLASNVPNISSEIFIEALTDNFISARKAAVITLGKIKFLSALNPLLEMLSNPSLEIKYEVIKSVVNIGKLGNASGIMNCFDEGNVHVKRAIPIILGRIHSDESISYLKELLHKNDPEVRCNAIQALEKLVQVKDARLVINLLDDINVDVRKASINALGVIKSKRAIDPLLKLLKNKDEEIRTLSLQSLEQIFISLGSYEKIYEVANSKNLTERKEAIKLLGLLKDVKSVDYMINSFKSSDNKTRKLAYTSLIQISKDKVPNQVLEGLKAKEWKIRSLCAKIVGKIGNDQQISLLLDLLKDPDNKVREIAIEAISKTHNQLIINEVKSLLSSSNWKIKRAAVKLLIKIGKEDSLDALLPLINDDDLFVKSWIALALGKFENINDISPFIEMLEDKDPKIRIAAARALGQLGDSSALNPLANSLWDDDWTVRKEIELALDNIDSNWLKLIKSDI